MTEDFYNTTGETDPDLSEYTGTASQQQTTIYQFIKANPDLIFSREDLRHLFPASTLTTSIVRSLCNLRDLGIIEVVGKVKGTCNRPIFVYKYIKPPTVQSTLLIEDGS